jgi:cell division protein FtsB
MNPLMIGTYLKWGGYALVAIVIGLAVWNVKSTYSENDSMRQTITQNESKIQTLQGDIKTQKDLNAEILKRKQAVEIVEKERIVYVDKIIKGDTVYVEKVKKEIEYIRVNAPETLDEYYYTEYNNILDCISDATKQKDTKCGTP